MNKSQKGTSRLGYLKKRDGSATRCSPGFRSSTPPPRRSTSGQRIRVALTGLAQAALLLVAAMPLGAYGHSNTTHKHSCGNTSHTHTPNRLASADCVDADTDHTHPTDDVTHMHGRIGTNPVGCHRSGSGANRRHSHEVDEVGSHTRLLLADCDDSTTPHTHHKVQQLTLGLDIINYSYEEEDAASEDDDKRPHIDVCLQRDNGTCFASGSPDKPPF